MVVGDNATIVRNASDAIESIQTTFLDQGGDDQIAGGTEDDILIGGLGRDNLQGNGGSDYLVGDHAKVQMRDGAVQRIESSSPQYGSDDTIAGQAGADLIIGGAGNDQIDAGADNDVVLGDEGTIVRNDGTIEANDIFSLASSFDGQDAIVAGTGDDIILGGGQQDTIAGNLGDDLILGDHGYITRNATDVTEQIESRFSNIGANDVIQGNAGDDQIIAGFANDRIQGNEGTDVIIGDNGRILSPNGVIARLETINPLDGGSDTISGQEAADYILGGSGDDTIDAGSDVAHDIILGDNGLIVRNDGSAQANDIFSTDVQVGGDDLILAGAGQDIVMGGGRNDGIVGNQGQDVLLGDHGYIKRNAADVIEQIDSRFNDDGGNDTIQGNEDEDVIIGGFTNDNITGNESNDLILGDNGTIDYALDGQLNTLDLIATTTSNLGGDDTIAGNDGNDRILGGFANDRIQGNLGDDIILGDSGQLNYVEDANAATLDRITTLDPAIGGDDNITGDEGKDWIWGGAQSDVIAGNADDDVIFGDNGQISLKQNNFDTIETLNANIGGHDRITGDDGEDVILAGGDADPVRGNAGKDVILGDHGQLTYLADGNPATLDQVLSTDVAIGGDDQLQGNDARDLMLGGAGNDRIQGNDGADVLLGDSAKVSLTTGEIRFVETIAPNVGGNDQIQGNAGDDAIVGGFGGDELLGNGGNDAILGDNGQLDYTFNGNDGTNQVGPDNDLSTLDLIITTDPTSGGNDRILGGFGNDKILGGTGADVIAGDDLIGSFDPATNAVSFLSTDKALDLSANWVQIGRGDLNGDGQADILWRDRLRWQSRYPVAPYRWLQRDLVSRWHKAGGWWFIAIDDRGLANWSGG